MASVLIMTREWPKRIELVPKMAMNDVLLSLEPFPKH